MTIAEIVLVYLKKRGYNGLFISNEPPTPDNTITIYDVDITPSSRFKPACKETANFQVRVRSISYNRTMRLARRLKEKLETVSNEAIKNYQFSVDFLDGIHPLGYDKSGRFIATVNFTARVQKID